jgi:hypothetical protein
MLIKTPKQTQLFCVENKEDRLELKLGFLGIKTYL